jgi:hypothetical protein
MQKGAPDHQLYLSSGTSMWISFKGTTTLDNTVTYLQKHLSNNRDSSHKLTHQTLVLPNINNLVLK